MSLTELTQAALIGVEEETNCQGSDMRESAVEAEMSSLSLEAAREQPVTTSHSQETLPRLLEDIPDDVLLAYTKRRLEAREPKRIAVGHRSTPDGHDTSQLSLFYHCPGSGYDSRLNYNFHCTIRTMTFKDVVPHADQSIADLRFNNVFQLARLLAIFEHERQQDRRRFLMNDLNYNLVTFESVQKAYVFYKDHCAHVFRAIMQHDGSHAQLLHDGNVGIDINQLNDLMNSGIRFAARFSWKDIKIDEAERPVLILLPSGFRKIGDIYQQSQDVIFLVYHGIADIGSLVNGRTARACVFVGPTTPNQMEQASWLKACSPLGALVRTGTKLIGVAPPRGEEAWEKHRFDMAQLFSVIKDTSAAAKQLVVNKIPTVISAEEPCMSVGKHSRATGQEIYYKGAVKDYMTALQEYVAADVTFELAEKETAKEPESQEDNSNTLHRPFRGKRSLPPVRARFNPYMLPSRTGYQAPSRGNRTGFHPRRGKPYYC